MNERAEKREFDRYKQKLLKEAAKLSPNQQNMVNEITNIKANQKFDAYKNLLNNALLEAMRENHISIKRIDKIIRETNEKMHKEMDNYKEVV